MKTSCLGVPKVFFHVAINKMLALIVFFSTLSKPGLRYLLIINRISIEILWIFLLDSSPLQLVQGESVLVKLKNLVLQEHA